MADERTPLLEEGGVNHEATTMVFPSLKHALRLLPSQQLMTSKHIADIVKQSARAASVSHSYAFFFAVVLYLDSLSISASSQSRAATARSTQGLTIELWTSYSQLRLEESDILYISVESEILELLWTPILLDDESEFGPVHTSGE